MPACTTKFDPSTMQPAGVPPRAFIEDVPLIQQQDFYCGPTSLAMVMQWSGQDVSPADIAALAFSPGAGGTYLADMIGSARRSGQLAVNVTTFNQLLTEIAAGHPVIVFQNLGINIAPRWHYAVAVGYDLQKDEIYLNSGQLDRMIMPFQLFERTWKRGDFWALVVLPPDQLPVSVDQRNVLAAAAALERVNQLDAAARLYTTGAAQWPDNWLWQFGLGNALYAQGNLVGAQKALRAARAIDPTVPEIRTNLAHVNAELAGLR